MKKYELIITWFGETQAKRGYQEFFGPFDTILEGQRVADGLRREIDPKFDSDLPNWSGSEAIGYAQASDIYGQYDIIVPEN